MKNDNTLKNKLNTFKPLHFKHGQNDKSIQTLKDLPSS